MLPGICFTALSIPATSAAFVLRGSGHSLRGLSMMKVSATEGGIGSVATSAVPSLPNTR